MDFGHTKISDAIFLGQSLLLSTTVLNLWGLWNGICVPWNMYVFSVSKTNLTVSFTQKPTEIHWYSYNNTLPLSNGTHLKKGEKLTKDVNRLLIMLHGKNS